jgi:hypothetical protein
MLDALKARGYTPTDTEKLWNGLDPNGGMRSKLIVKRLEEILKKSGKATGDAKPSAPLRFDAKVRSHLENISAYLQRNSMTTEDLHRELDIDGDGKVDKREFVTRMSDLVKKG